MPNQNKQAKPDDKTEPTQGDTDAAELMAYRAVMAAMVPDFKLEDVTEHLYTNNKGELVYMPPKDDKPADKPADKPDPVDKPADKPVDKPAPTSNNAALQALSQGIGSGGSDKPKRLDATKMAPSDFLKNVDALAKQAAEGS